MTYDIDLKHLARMEQERARIKKLLEHQSLPLSHLPPVNYSASEEELTRETTWWMLDIGELEFTEELEVKLNPLKGDS